MIQEASQHRDAGASPSKGKGKDTLSRGEAFLIDQPLFSINKINIDLMLVLRKYTFVLDKAVRKLAENLTSREGPGLGLYLCCYSWYLK